VPLEIADDWDELDDEERAALHESIREGIEDMEERLPLGVNLVVAANEDLSHSSRAVTDRRGWPMRRFEPPQPTSRSRKDHDLVKLQRQTPR